MSGRGLRRPRDQLLAGLDRGIVAPLEGVVGVAGVRRCGCCASAEIAPRSGLIGGNLSPEVPHRFWRCRLQCR